MDYIQAFALVANTFETDGTAINMSKEGHTDRERWEYSCQQLELTLGMLLPTSFSDRTWKAYVTISLI